MTFDASGNLTGVEAVQTDPVQWLNTMVEELGCQVTRRKRSLPRASARASVRVLVSSTALSMHLGPNASPGGAPSHADYGVGFRDHSAPAVQEQRRPGISHHRVEVKRVVRQDVGPGWLAGGGRGE